MTNPHADAWNHDRTIVRFPDMAIEVVDERFRELIIWQEVVERLWTGGRWALSYLRCWLAIPRSSQMSLRLPVKKFCTGKRPLQFPRRQIFRPTRPTYFFA